MPLFAVSELGPYEIPAPIGEGAGARCGRPAISHPIGAIQVFRSEFSEHFERAPQDVGKCSEPGPSPPLPQPLRAVVTLASAAEEGRQLDVKPGERLRSLSLSGVRGELGRGFR